VRTTGKHQSVQCFLVSGDVRLKVLVHGQRWRSIPVGTHSAAGIHCLKGRGNAAEHFQRGDFFELWAELRIGSGIVLATHRTEEDNL